MTNKEGRGGIESRKRKSGARTIRRTAANYENGGPGGGGGALIALALVNATNVLFEPGRSDGRLSCQ